MSRPAWDEKTLTIVRTFWLLIVGTALVLGAVFWLIPHLGGDGVLSRDDIYLVAGVVAFGGVVAFPDRVFQGLGRAVQAWRDFRGKSEDGPEV